MKARFSGARTVTFLALRDVGRDKRLALLVITILAASYVNLIFFSSFMTGLSNTFENSLVGLMTSHIVIEPKSNMKAIAGVDSIERKITSLPGVVAVSPRQSAGGTITYKSKVVPAGIIAFTPSKEREVTVLADKVEEGDFLSDSDTGSVLLGRSIAKEEVAEGMSSGLGVSVGERIKIAYSNGIVREYRVKGIIFGNFWGTDHSVYITSREHEAIYGKNNDASNILVRLSDKTKTGQYKFLIMGENVGGEVKSWEEYAGFIRDITNSLTMMNNITTFVALLVAAMTIAVIIFINTTRKRRHIGILKAVGAGDGVILSIFLLEAAIFGILGIAVGIILGQGIMGYLDTHPMDMPMGLVRPVMTESTATNAAAYLLAAVVLAGFYPAYRASRENILKAVASD